MPYPPPRPAAPASAPEPAAAAPVAPPANLAPSAHDAPPAGVLTGHPTPLRELVARAHARDRVLQNLRHPSDRWLAKDEEFIQRAVDHAWRDFLPTADTSLAAVKASGYVCVPREPTPEILEAGWAPAHMEDAKETWKEMIAAWENEK